MISAHLVNPQEACSDSSGTPILVSATLEYKDGRILFVKSPYSLKDEIKAMRGSRWHGYDEPDPRKIWSVEDCQRNRFQLSFLMGEDAYAWFDRPLVRHEYTRPLKDHQKDLTDIHHAWKEIIRRPSGRRLHFLELGCRASSASPAFWMIHPEQTQSQACKRLPSAFWVLFPVTQRRRLLSPRDTSSPCHRLQDSRRPAIPPHRNGR
ncbi:MAG: hypothetical protein ABR915_04660 [Thermoguttaceae bacterium]